MLTDSTYGARIAASYDTRYDRTLPSDATAAYLLTLCPPGSHALELGVGTGRIACRLAALGVSVVGVDISEEMLTMLRRRSGKLPVTGVHRDMGNLSDLGEFGLVYCVFNGLLAVPHQRQRSVFASVIEVLRPGGYFVLEANAPRRPGSDRSFAITKLSRAMLRIEASNSIQEKQVMYLNLLELDRAAHKIESYPTTLYWRTPEQVDALAADVGLISVGRVNGWPNTPQSAAARSEIFVYRRAESHG